MNPTTGAALVFNETRFRRMACGDLSGFYDMGLEYFEETRGRMIQWQAMLDAREYVRLGEEFHRCKSGAAMFGLERLFDLLGLWETDSKIERTEVDLKRFSSELEMAEKAITAQFGSL